MSAGSVTTRSAFAPIKLTPATGHRTKIPPSIGLRNLREEWKADPMQFAKAFPNDPHKLDVVFPGPTAGIAKT